MRQIPKAPVLGVMTQAQKSIREWEEFRPALTELCKQSAEGLSIRFEAYKRIGFTEEQAFELLKLSMGGK